MIIFLGCHHTNKKIFLNTKVSIAHEIIYKLHSKDLKSYNDIFENLNKCFNIFELNNIHFDDKYKCTVFFNSIKPKDAISIKQHYITQKINYDKLQNYAILYYNDLNLKDTEIVFDLTFKIGESKNDEPITKENSIELIPTTSAVTNDKEQPKGSTSS